MLMEDPVIIGIAKDHGITPAQVLLKYLLQRDIIVLPKSSNEGRIKANYEVRYAICVHRARYDDLMNSTANGMA